MRKIFITKLASKTQNLKKKMLRKSSPSNDWAATF